MSSGFSEQEIADIRRWSREESYLLFVSLIQPGRCRYPCRRVHL
ncbi:hypothetical protein [Thalassomonas sp. RHCl1]|nr:hypothetical protein [Thalassomonas sp. RHCl1]